MTQSSKSANLSSCVVRCFHGYKLVNKRQTIWQYSKLDHCSALCIPASQVLQTDYGMDVIASGSCRWKGKNGPEQTDLVATSTLIRNTPKSVKRFGLISSIGVERYGSLPFNILNLGGKSSQCSAQITRRKEKGSSFLEQVESQGHQAMSIHEHSFMHHVMAYAVVGCFVSTLQTKIAASPE